MTIAEYLTSENLSISELAKKIGAHYTVVSRWCAGTFFPSARYMAKLYAISGGKISYESMVPPPPKTRSRKRAA